jgi:choline dehydrogenase-like flavoprotein
MGYDVVVVGGGAAVCVLASRGLRDRAGETGSGPGRVRTATGQAQNCRQTTEGSGLVLEAD